ncbi:unnamed protein product [Closterium sp. Naga37s-1]|nr:unnamed protein product [Closterium sp. Naga37s-1]
MVRDDVLLHCPSSVRTLVKRHVYSRFVNSSYLFAGTTNIFRDQVTTRANVDFFLPHVDLVAAGNSTTELLIIASGQAQRDLGTARCGHSEVWTQRDLGTARCVDEVTQEGRRTGGQEDRMTGGHGDRRTGGHGDKRTGGHGDRRTATQCGLHSPDNLAFFLALWFFSTLTFFHPPSLTHSLTLALPCPAVDGAHAVGASVACTHPADDRHVIANLLNRARSRAEATARFYPGNSTMAEPSLLLKDEVEPVLNGIDIFFFYPLSHTFANRSLAPTPSSPTLPHSCRNLSSSLPFFRISAPFLKDTSLDLLLSSPHSPH